MIFDTMIIGQVCLDTNTDYDGTVEKSYGGAALFAGFAAGNMGNKTAILVKRNAATVDLANAYSGCENASILPIDSGESTIMENTYFSIDRERRISRCGGMIDPYRADELPHEESRVYHIAGLVRGDISANLMYACHKRGLLAVDVQCMMRRVLDDGSMRTEDWPEKLEMLPCIDFLKTDAAEAEVLTGQADREIAAGIMFGWGAKEIMITHNSEVIVYDGRTMFRQPLRPRNLSGRTGRGDTCFAGYITERLREDIPTALVRAAALVSLKMETPGPFRGRREDVDRYICEFY